MGGPFPFFCHAPTWTHASVEHGCHDSLRLLSVPSCLDLIDHIVIGCDGQAFKGERCTKAVPQQTLAGVFVVCINRVAGTQAVTMAHTHATLDCSLLESTLVAMHTPAVSVA